jgi:hypothetical protein
MIHPNSVAAEPRSIDAGVPAILSSALLDRGAHLGIPVIIACAR